MTQDEILVKAKSLLDTEIAAIRRAKSNLDVRFVRAVEVLEKAREEKKKIVFMGMGKSHYVAAKICSSFMSTGVHAVFVHPAEAFHGDLGVIHEGDPCVLFSKSGTTAELLGLLPFLEGRNPVIAITGDISSPLAKRANVALDASVEKEACPINMLPSASTTAALALGDALVAVVAEDLGFSKKTFAGFHPGGSIGKRLNTTVDQVMLPRKDIPSGDKQMSLQEVARTMSDKPVGAFCVVDAEDHLEGIFTDGDMRRAMAKGLSPQTPVGELMAKDPITLKLDYIIDQALTVMEQPTKPVNCAPVLDENSKVLGIARLHDLI